MHTIVPLDRESPFSVEELFFSTTDLKGIIRSSNEVFVRVSKHPHEELDGAAHNIIRHPDMPRAVFRVMWTELQAGRPIAAYVKNMAADGSYYWVVASVVPVPGGYLSVRLKPTTDTLATVKRLYAAVRAHELEVEDGDLRKRKRSIEAGVARLSELLAEAGFDSYAAFENAILPAEVTSRDAHLASAVRDRVEPPPPGADRHLVAILEGCACAYDFLDGLAANLQRYAALNASLEGKADFVVELAEAIRLFSMNAQLAASRLGSEGAALGAVAGLMRARSDTAGPIISELHAQIVGAVEGLGGIGFRIAAAKLHAEMLMRFASELLHGGVDAHTRGELGILAENLDDEVERLLAAVSSVDDRLRAVTARAAELERELKRLRALEVNGRVEAARTADSEHVHQLFVSIGEQVAAAHDELAGFDAVEVVTAQRDHLAETRVRADVGALRRHVDAALSAVAAA
ncbi:MAG TPA: PAS domain-containing protein [Capillimicrobium sp.]|nr:PAS domain-containing protein [Capillimicrobium sp.]